MTGKLIKYEFRSIVKIMGIVWAALPIIALINGILGELVYSGSDYEDTPLFMDLVGLGSVFLFGGIFMAMLAVTVLVVLLRFYRGLLRDEGYLMHTLPVKTWQLITAKGVVAVCVTLISLLVAAVSILILIGFGGGITDVMQILKEAGSYFAASPGYLLIALEVLVLLAAWIAANVYRIYASMSIGQLAKRHKILLSVGVYLGIGAAGAILLPVIDRILDFGVVTTVLDAVFGWIHISSGIEAVRAGLMVLILIAVIETAVFHIISEQLLRKKLNLE